MKQGVSAVAAWMMLAAWNAEGMPIIDFSLGPVGPLGTYTTIVGGVQVDAATTTGPSAALYRWHEPMETCGGLCAPHSDRGFGVLSAGEGINPAEPEVNPGEFIRMMAPAGYTITEVWLTSVNNRARGRVYLGHFPAGPLSVSFAAGEGAFSSASTGVVNVGSFHSSTAWFVPYGPVADNWSNVWGVTLSSKPQCLTYMPCDPPLSVPEPAALWLFGGGLLCVAWMRRPRRQIVLDT